MPNPGAEAMQTTMIAPLRRHWLVWVCPEFHAAMAEQIADATLHEIASNYFSAGWPLVMCSQGGGSAVPYVPVVPVVPIAARKSVMLGMPLPPRQGKHRLAFFVPVAAIIRVAPPLLLADVVPKLTNNWYGHLPQLLSAASEINLELRLFGSLAMEILTGDHYLTPQSDIDLLWQPLSLKQLDMAMEILSAWQTRCGVRVDGEIFFGNDSAVAWREWQTAQQTKGRVLVKSLGKPRLCFTKELLAQLPPATVCSTESVSCT